MQDEKFSSTYQKLSARPLKEFVARFLPHFRSKEQQDCDEFLQFIIQKCDILRDLTQSVVHVTYKCKSCENVINTEDTRNVLYEDLTESSIAEIFSNTERTFPNFKEKCTLCKTKTIHEHHEKILMLPEVLIVKLQRYQKNKFNRIINKNCMDIDPSIILQLNEADYMLNAVVTHYGETTHKGHYIATLYRNGQMIDCNDEVVRPTNKIPKMGYLFFYDRVKDLPLALPSVSVGNLEERIPIVLKSPSYEENSSSESTDHGLREKRKRIHSDNFEDEVGDEFNIPARKTHKLQKTCGQNALNQNNDLESPQTSKISEKLIKDKKPFVCKGCNKPYERIRAHLIRSKATTNCESAYTPKELKEFIENSKRDHQNAKNFCKQKSKEKQVSEGSVYCKGCKKPYKLIRSHLVKTRSTTKCEDAYSSEEIKAFEEEYKKNHKKAKKSHKQKKPEKVAEQNKTHYQKHHSKIAQRRKEWYKKKKEDLGNQFLRFTRECFGPIYTCICCCKDLFKRSVEELKGDIEKKILIERQMHDKLTFDESFKIKDEYQEWDEDKQIMLVQKIQEGFSLCHTCIRYLKQGKMPPMCSKNGLEPSELPECIKELTNVEKQLIVKNLFFIKVRNLPKTRMEAMNDR